MQITKDIVHDLLPVYLAGEASLDTRAVVEAYLAEDPKLREIVAAARTEQVPPVEAPAGLEQQSLQRTRRLLGRKTVWLGCALVSSFAPVILRPFWLADITFATSLGLWAAYLTTCKRLAATGLEAPRRAGPRFLWALTGSLLGLAAGYLVRQQTGYHRAVYDFPAVTCGLALRIGEKLHRIPQPGDLDRSISLFGEHKRP
jgi:anti-sigma factor RsiW